MNAICEIYISIYIYIYIYIFIDLNYCYLKCLSNKCMCACI